MRHHEEDRAEYEGLFRQCLERKEPFVAKARVCRADGQWRWIESYGVPRLGANGELLAFAGTSFDITERQALEAEREVLLESERAARTDAELATRAKDEFLATLSHELRTPLNAILGWVQILQAGELSNDRVRHAIDVIARNGKLQAQLIEDILDISRIISKKLDIERTTVRVQSLVDAAFAAQLPAARAKHIQMTQRLAQDLPAIEGDPKRLQQVLGNVVSNAIKFTPEGGRVELRCTARDGVVLIEVEDSGIGIDAEFLPLVFDRFRQADSRATRQHGGLGLGLAISRHLIEQHNGDIAAHSDGQGTPWLTARGVTAGQAQSPGDRLPASPSRWRAGYARPRGRTPRSRPA